MSLIVTQAENCCNSIYPVNRASHDSDNSSVGISDQVSSKCRTNSRVESITDSSIESTNSGEGVKTNNTDVIASGDKSDQSDSDNTVCSTKSDNRSVMGRTKSNE